MKTNKILITGTSIRADLLKPLIDSGFEIENPTHLLTENELIEKLKTVSGYLLGGDEFVSSAAIASADELKIIAFLGVGYQSFIDVDAATKKGILITNTPGTLSNSVAEFTTGLLLNGTRKIYQYASDYSKNITGNETKQNDIANLHIGIVGLGGIGTRIAEILRFGFNSKVSYFSRTRKVNEEKRLNISYSDLDQLLTDVDVLILQTPSTQITTGMIGLPEIEKMKKGIVIINAARPEIIDMNALLSGLKSDKIQYAAFDGFYKGQSQCVNDLKEMIPNKLMITGHIASLTHEARDGMAKLATQSIINILTSGQDVNVVN